MWRAAEDIQSKARNEDRYIHKDAEYSTDLQDQNAATREIHEKHSAYECRSDQGDRRHADVP